jgi:hypothetical protein
MEITLLLTLIIVGPIIWHGESHNYRLAMLNQGISVNRLVTDTPYFGIKGLDQLERDVLNRLFFCLGLMTSGMEIMTLNK